VADEELRIGDLAKATATKVETIRYYERIGLLPTPGRTAGNYRAYDRRHLERLSFIRHARELGFSIEAVRDLLQLSDDPERPCEDADRIARAHLADIKRRMARLAALKAELERMLARCEGGRIADCRVIEVLADHTHGQCISPDHRKDGATERQATEATAARGARSRT
jgi:Cu(I)-responsive transcriptional regulator